MLKLTHGSTGHAGVSTNDAAGFADAFALAARGGMQVARPLISNSCTCFRNAARTTLKDFRNDSAPRAPYWRAGFFVSAARHGRPHVAFSRRTRGSTACNSYRTCKKCRRAILGGAGALLFY